MYLRLWAIWYKHNKIKYIFIVGPIFIGYMKRSRRAESDTILKFLKQVILGEVMEERIILTLGPQ